MMFGSDLALKKIGVLSGGEKCRVLLGKLLIAPSNLLLLDEPTHHLDMESCAAMADAVDQFKGASIIVTHDEYFLKKVATKLIVFKKDQIILFPGTYEQFLDRIGWEDIEIKQEKVKKESSFKEEKRARAEFIAMRSKILKPFEKRITEIESTIERLEKQLHLETDEMATAAQQNNAQEITRLSKSIHQITSETEKLYKEYEEVHAKYETEKLNWIEKS
jgi:ATP-binding cassette subfamily F protein 3